MKIAIAGIGYIGLSNAILLSQNHEVVDIDIDPEKVEKLNNKISTILDADIEEFLASKDLNLTATLNKEIAYNRPDFVIIAKPTDYNTSTCHYKS